MQCLLADVVLNELRKTVGQVGEVFVIRRCLLLQEWMIEQLVHAKPLLWYFDKCVCQEILHGLIQNRIKQLLLLAVVQDPNDILQRKATWTWLRRGQYLEQGQSKAKNVNLERVFLFDVLLACT